MAKSSERRIDIAVFVKPDKKGFSARGQHEAENSIGWFTEVEGAPTELAAIGRALIQIGTDMLEQHR